MTGLADGWVMREVWRQVPRKSRAGETGVGEDQEFYFGYVKVGDVN